MKVLSSGKGFAVAVLCLTAIVGFSALAQPAKPDAKPAAATTTAQPAATSCGTGSYAALMTAKLPPSARPGNPAIYKDCR